MAVMASLIAHMIYGALLGAPPGLRLGLESRRGVRPGCDRLRSVMSRQKSRGQRRRCVADTSEGPGERCP